MSNTPVVEVGGRRGGGGVVSLRSKPDLMLVTFTTARRQKTPSLSCELQAQVQRKK
jgi:hypothetical protein